MIQHVTVRGAVALLARDLFAPTCVAFVAFALGVLVGAGYVLGQRSESEVVKATGRCVHE